jgi:CubicO group peptidase (beta-lactamase class C family)
MQLAEQSKLDLDAPVTAYIPWFRLGSAEGGAGVTVRHLLSQTSGIPRHAGYPPIIDPQFSLETAVRDLPRFGTVGAPGERFVYSNSNYAALGLLVETVSGQTYEQYVREHILEPLGMTRTYFSEPEARAAGLAQGYTATFGFPMAVNHPFLPHATPYYQLISTADDLARFAAPFLNQGRSGDFQLLSPDSVKAMTTAHRPGDNYGLGWWTSVFHGVPAISHGGDAHGFRNELVMLPDRNAAVILLTNENARLTASYPISVLAWSTAAVLIGKPWYSPVANFRWLSTAVALIVLVLTASFFTLLALLASWRARVLQGDLGLLAGLWLPGLVSVLVGVLVLRYGPRLVDHANWTIALPTQPELAWTGLAWSIGLVLAGSWHIAMPWVTRWTLKG